MANRAEGLSITYYENMNHCRWPLIYSMSFVWFISMLPPNATARSSPFCGFATNTGGPKNSEPKMHSLKWGSEDVSHNENSLKIIISYFVSQNMPLFWYAPIFLYFSVRFLLFLFSLSVNCNASSTLRTLIRKS